MPRRKNSKRKKYRMNWNNNGEVQQAAQRAPAVRDRVAADIVLRQDRRLPEGPIRDIKSFFLPITL